MTKTPYEIRLDVLRMAQEMLEMETRLKVESLKMENERLRSQNEWADTSATVNAVATASYTAADLTARASELYAFVNKKTVD